MTSTRLTAAVLFGGPSPEHDLSVLTGVQTAHALAHSPRWDVVPCYWSKYGAWHELVELPGHPAALLTEPPPESGLELVAGPLGGFVRRFATADIPPNLDVDVAFVCCHGGPGEDGTLQRALELAGIRHTGPSGLGALTASDKLAFAQAMAAARIPVLPRVADGTVPPYGGPYIVKPRFGGGCIGIEVVGTFAEVAACVAASPHYAEGAVVEPFLADAVDLRVSVRTFPDVATSAIEEIVRVPRGRPMRYLESYVAEDTLIRRLPAPLDGGLDRLVRELAVEVVSVTGLTGVARVDLLRNGDDVYVSEVSGIPGGWSRALWGACGVSLPELVDGLGELALSRPVREFSAAGADGRALRLAPGFAGKAVPEGVGLLSATPARES